MLRAFSFGYDKYIIRSHSDDGKIIETIVDDCPEEMMEELAELDKGYYSSRHKHLYTNFEHIDYDDDEQDK